MDHSPPGAWIRPQIYNFRHHPTIASSFARGVQPSKRVAFSLVAFMTTPSCGAPPQYLLERKTQRFIAL
jgi:hypothetical protein